MLNLFAFKGTNFSKLKEIPNPVGPENDKFLLKYAHKADLVIGAWGNNGKHRNRCDEVLKMIPDIHCLRVTKMRQPGHPLYLPICVKHKEFHQTIEKDGSS